MGTPQELVARYFACVVPLIKSLFLPNSLPSTDRQDTPTDWTLGRKFTIKRRTISLDGWRRDDRRDASPRRNKQDKEVDKEGFETVHTRR